MADEAQFKSTSFEMTNEAPVVISYGNIQAMGRKIHDALDEAVNEGKNVLLLFFLKHNVLFPTQRLFFEGIEGTVRSSSMQHLEIISNQGNRVVFVQFVGGASPFGLAEALSSDDDDDDNDDAPAAEAGNEPPATEAPPAAVPPPQQQAPRRRHQRRQRRVQDSDDSSSSEGEDFAGLSQLTI
ncbi:hypothetical protein SEMRO_1401_G269420.1 [Seminavis robusta]|uniref:Uncharacterized protein n=1 Tax=Seminavis robusta TaxID=568900 RepID=A0A9N8EQC1_9STRA|nr:hypothetical protein SEMRO_1401_G269420.1 [Seminavis robusta]|eukprot:Sro1401_g269420.1 n/a (183) ;mRNA; r:7339-7887